MKYLIISVTLLFSSVAIATQMEGFGAYYYQDDPAIPNFDTRKGLAPDVIIGDNFFVMEFSRLTDIAKTTGVVVNQSDRASWLCLTSEKVNYWFISDNEMGHGDLTSVAMAKSGNEKECSAYNGKISVTVKGVPLLDASPEKISALFSNGMQGNIMQYCTETKSYGDFTQVNCLEYHFEKNDIKGVFIYQVTAN